VHNIKVLIVKYKDEIIQAIGVQDESSMVLIEIPSDDGDEIKKDKNTMNSLTKYMKTNLQQSKGYIGEGDAIYFLGNYGSLSISIEDVKIKI